MRFVPLDAVKNNNNLGFVGSDYVGDLRMGHDVAESAGFPSGQISQGLYRGQVLSQLDPRLINKFLEMLSDIPRNVYQSLHRAQLPDANAVLHPFQFANRPLPLGPIRP